MKSNTTDSGFIPLLSPPVIGFKNRGNVTGSELSVGCSSGWVVKNFAVFIFASFKIFFALSLKYSLANASLFEVI